MPQLRMHYKTAQGGSHCCIKLGSHQRTWLEEFPPLGARCCQPPAVQGRNQTRSSLQEPESGEARDLGTCERTTLSWERKHLSSLEHPPVTKMEAVMANKGEIEGCTAFHRGGNKMNLKLKVTNWYLIQFSSVMQSCPTICNPVNHSTPGLPVNHQLPESTKTHVHWFCDAIQPSHPLSSPSPLSPTPSQHQSLFKWVSSSH